MRSRPTRNGFVRRFSSIAISGKTSWAITTSGARCRRGTTRGAAPIIGGAVMQRPNAERLDEIRHVVERAPGERGTILGRRLHPDDPHAVVLLLVRKVRLEAQ